jgi:hypothetical protein
VKGLFGRLVILGVVGIGFLASAGLTSPPPGSLAERAHSSPVMAKITWPNGYSRTLSFEGVGCADSMCSRVRIQSMVQNSLAVENTWLDSVASITAITGEDALFTFKDGTARRLQIVAGNRFLYFAEGKTEMGKFESVEFVAR